MRWLKTKLPKYIKINGILYSINFLNDLTDEDGNRIWGKTIYEKSLILVDSSLDRQHTKQTLIHEVVHAILWESSCTDICNDEQVVNPLANSLYQVITDNFKEKNPNTN
ncbi:hypothetical protein M8332_07010 (plasmid) [Fructilactobacillus ixorae]|uniref:SprT-like domain-containing protein n=1 Tax=Fructilactobacillus ixorae TaxID=1750535 RepID=A0ABY5C5A7_9LACO|nr:hypothetical protein [Fructilactobacillus ixorae]USS93965.1 hypothetical protein M8332_07010 [Fructilactobacillus ixorae]